MIQQQYEHKAQIITTTRESSDGFRILITRFRPRYIKKENESWDACMV
jgi:uncharacterized protein YeaO (DUF488 family)